MNISILGSTGSIGKQAIDVIRNLKSQNKDINIVAFAAHSNINILKNQILEFKPKYIAVYDEFFAKKLKSELNINILYGKNCINEIAKLDEVDVVLNALVGNFGLAPTIEALNKNKIVALANKEVLVTAGEIIKKRIDQIIPIDSEHSAIFQCLKGKDKPKKIYLTASGGALREWEINKIKNASIEDVLKHPNWNMGKKITVDSATMMNKALEIIEAKWLFDLDFSQIEVLIHPESIVHSMVEFEDGQILAQMGPPDMRLAIQYALTHPKRNFNNFDRLDFSKPLSLNFKNPDYNRYPSLNLAYQALKEGGHYPAILNASNEIAVDLFLSKKIDFISIYNIIEKTLNEYNKNGYREAISIESIKIADTWARKFALNLI